jgi:hypothetical protein
MSRTPKRRNNSSEAGDHAVLLGLRRYKDVKLANGAAATSCTTTTGARTHSVSLGDSRFVARRTHRTRMVAL